MPREISFCGELEVLPRMCRMVRSQEDAAAVRLAGHNRPSPSMPWSPRAGPSVGRQPRTAGPCGRFLAPPDAPPAVGCPAPRHSLLNCAHTHVSESSSVRGAARASCRGQPDWPGRSRVVTMGPGARACTFISAHRYVLHVLLRRGRLHRVAQDPSASHVEDPTCVGGSL